MIIKSTPFAIFSRRPKVQSISVSQSEVQISNIGGIHVPVVTFNPENAVDRGLIYKSEDTSIATVDNTGVITAKKEGTTYVVITSVDGNKTTRVKIVVKIPVTQLTLDKTSHTFTKVGQQIRLSALIIETEAKGSITWRSTNTSVATVDDDGLVTAKSPGTCQIIAEKNGVQATSQIIVKQSATGVITDTNNLSLSVGETKKVGYSIIPENATDKSVVWYSNNTKVATVDENGNIKGVGNGSTRIEVYPTNNPFSFVFINVTVTTSSSKSSSSDS